MHPIILIFLARVSSDRFDNTLLKYKNSLETNILESLRREELIWLGYKSQMK